MQEDVIGIGVGPSNLSLAALLAPHEDIDARFLDAKPSFQWHPGLMLPGVSLQVSHLKDLVTLVDPTSRYSFLSFLVAHNRLYQFINASFAQVLRQEFNQYYQWVADSLRSVEFGTRVDAVSLNNGRFLVQTDRDVRETRTVVLGTGQRSFVPECARPYLGRDVFHSSEYLDRNADSDERNVLVVGGGQSGAEIVYHLLTAGRLPRKIIWLTRRHNFLPLEESAFTNELYAPEYSDYFFSLCRERRVTLLEQQKLASDGISARLIEAIYRRVYELTHLLHQDVLELRPGRELLSLQRSHGRWTADSRHLDRGTSEQIHVDVVILSTGYVSARPGYLDEIAGRLDWSADGARVNDDFSIAWDGPPQCKLYLQNGARNWRGIADPNLGLIPWRSAKIANAIAERSLYNIEGLHGVVRWDHHQAPARSLDAANRSQPTAALTAQWTGTNDYRSGR